MRTSEFTTPLQGRPYYQNTGIIRVYDRMNRLFNIGEVLLERYDDQNFQYIFKPYWASVDSLPEGLFQGIPGINMDVRKEAYYRVNMTPSFISMRTPGESRADVKELMASVGLDYYDRFEWLLRTESRCGDDNLVVTRKACVTEQRVKFGETDRHYFIPEDDVEIQSMNAFHSSNAKLIEDLYGLLQSGCKIFILDEKRYIEDDERKTMLYLLKNMLICSDRYNRTRKAEGIQQAKEKGKYKGRKPISIDSQLLQKVRYEFSNHNITEKEAMELLGIASRATFYRKLKESQQMI